MYNKIRNFSIKEGKRKNRLADKEDRAVAEQVTLDNMNHNFKIINHLFRHSTPRPECSSINLSMVAFWTVSMGQYPRERRQLSSMRMEDLDPR